MSDAPMTGTVPGAPPALGGQNAALQEQPKPGDGLRPDHPARGRCEILDHDRGVVREVGPDGQPRKNFAVVGFASSSRMMAPFDDPSWSIWGLNQLDRLIPRADRWFDIHRNWDQELVPGTDYHGFVKNCGMPFYMMQRVPEYPTTVTYPLDRLMKKFGVDYFTSTIAYMIALAIDEIDWSVEQRMREAPPNGLASAWDVVELARTVYQEHMLGIFGVDLIVGEEYDWQKACAEFWIGTAAARGIRVWIPPTSALCKQLFRYGYEREPAQFPVALSEYEEKLGMLTQERNKLIAKLAMVEGGMELCTYYRDLATLRLRGGVYK